MRLGIVSDCIHYKNEAGQVGTENHIMLRQMEELSRHFTKTIMACPFDQIDATKVITWYNADIQFVQLPMAGGDTWKDKVKFLQVIPKWLAGFKMIDANADIVYQRFPNNLNIPGFFYFYFKRKKVFATYTGTWAGFNGEPITYRLQRWLLQKLFRGPVWVYTSFTTGSSRIKPGISPSYSMTEWLEETDQVKQRISRLQQQGLPCLRMITVGKLIDYKNQLTILKACVILKREQIPFSLKIVGDGPMFGELSDFIKENELSSAVLLMGKMNYQQLRTLYRQADVVVQAPLLEGFGKVPVEGLFHGAIPVLNNVSMAAFMTGKNEERGFLFDAANPQLLVDKLIDIKNKVSILPSIIENGRAFAKTQTLESWANEYYETVCAFYENN